MGVDSSDQQLKLARMNDILLSFLNAQTIVNAKRVLQKHSLHMTLTGLLSFLSRRSFLLKRHTFYPLIKVKPVKISKEIELF